MIIVRKFAALDVYIILSLLYYTLYIILKQYHIVDKNYT